MIMSFHPDFEDIPNNDLQYKCKGCGELVYRGVFSMSQHWCDCTGKYFFNALKANPPKTIEDVEKLQDKHLNQKK